MTGHSHSTGQGCFMRDDTFTADTDGVSGDLTILVNRDLLSVPGFSQTPPLPAMPPGIPAPPNFGDNNGYSFVLRIPGVDGNDHFEQVSNPDHLHDTDVQQQPSASITTEWDLSRE